MIFLVVSFIYLTELLIYHLMNKERINTFENNIKESNNIQSQIQINELENSELELLSSEKNIQRIRFIETKGIQWIDKTNNSSLN